MYYPSCFLEKREFVSSCLSIEKTGESMAEALNDDPVYVAVSKDVRESKSTLLWALRNLRLKKLFLLHVHQQISMNPTCKASLLQALILLLLFSVPRKTLIGDVIIEDFDFLCFGTSLHLSSI